MATSLADLLPSAHIVHLPASSPKISGLSYLSCRLSYPISRKLHLDGVELEQRGVLIFKFEEEEERLGATTHEASLAALTISTQFYVARCLRSSAWVRADGLYGMNHYTFSNPFSKTRILRHSISTRPSSGKVYGGERRVIRRDFGAFSAAAVFSVY